MKIGTVRRSLAAAGAVVLVATGCGGAGTDAASGSVRQLAEEATFGVHLDFDPLASPQDAVGVADLIVQGTLVEVDDGIRLRDPESVAAARPGPSYTTFVIEVAEVMHGSPDQLTSGKAYVQILTSSATSPDRLAELNPQASVVAVLSDITRWRPSPATTVQRPAGVPAGAALYTPFPDGMWLQGETDSTMVGIGVHPDELARGWGAPATVNEFATALAREAG